MSLPKSVGLNLGLAFIYCLIGKLIIMMAYPSGYATPFFPPSGIALAALLVGGNSLIWGTLFGAYCLVICTVTSHDPDMLIFVALLIAAGATLQALLGVWLIKRCVGFPNALEQPRDIGLFLLLGGPASCWCSATTGTYGLWLLDALPFHDALTGWWVWMVSDTLGVWIMAPLVLVVIGEPKADWRYKRLPVGLPMLLALLAAVAAYQWELEWERGRQRFSFIERSESLADKLQQNLDGYLAIIDSLERLFTSTDDVSREQFRAFVQPALNRYPGIQALAWLPLITDLQRSAHETAVRQEGYPHYQITETGGQGQMVRRQAAQRYYPVTFIEPYQGNEQALGHDPAKLKDRQQAMRQAYESGLPASTIIHKLVQDKVAHPSIIIYQAIYPTKLINHYGEPKGFVGGVFHLDDIIENALRTIPHNDIDVRLYDITNPRQTTLLHSTHDNITSPFPFSRTRTFQLAGKNWKFEFLPGPGYYHKQLLSRDWIVLSCGLIFISLWGIYLFYSYGQEHRSRQLAEQRSGELFHAYRDLQIVKSQLDALFDEREKLQLDLHDDLLQVLYATGMNVELAKQSLYGEDPKDKIDLYLDKTIQQLRDVMTKVRHYITRPSLPTDLAGRLRSTLESLMPLEIEKAPRLLIHIQSDVTNGMSEIQEKYLLLIAQEAVSNALRHANAEHIDVRLSRNQERTCLSIKDDGRGFYVGRSNRPDGCGLQNITTRAMLIGGECHIKSSPGMGSEITITIPVSATNITASS